MKLLRAVFYTLVFSLDREAGDTRPPMVLVVAVVVVAVLVLMVAWHALSQAALAATSWAGLLRQWWFIGGLLLVGLALGQAGRR